MNEKFVNLEKYSRKKLAMEFSLQFQLCFCYFYSTDKNYSTLYNETCFLADIC